MKSPEFEKRHHKKGDAPNTNFFELDKDRWLARARLSRYFPLWMFKFIQNKAPTSIYRVEYALQCLNEFRKSKDPKYPDM